jgi:hypothetical protein
VDLYQSQYVQGKSKVEVTISASGTYGSTIKSRSTTVKSGTNLISSSSSSSFTSGILNYSGTITIATTVTDSRGRITTVTSTITVIEYQKPQVEYFFSYRTSGGDEEDPNGSFIRLYGRAVIAPIENTNTKLVKLQYRVAGETLWEDATESTSYYSVYLTKTVAADPNLSYETRMYVEDYDSLSELRREVGTAFVLMDFNASGKGLAIGKVSEVDAFEVAIPAFFDGIQGYIVEAGTNINGTYVKFGDGTMICYMTVASVEGLGTYPLPASFNDTSYSFSARPRGTASSTTGGFFTVEGYVQSESILRLKRLTVTTTSISYSVGGLIMVICIGRWK